VRGQGAPNFIQETLVNTYNIQFKSQSFKVITEHKPKVFELLKSEVEKRLEEIQNSYSRISIEKVLFLTCLHLAEDKFLLKKAVDNKISRLESQAKSILKDLESSSKGSRLEIIT